MGNELVTKADKIITHDYLSPAKHISKTSCKTYKQLTNVKIAFHHMDEEMINISDDSPKVGICSSSVVSPQSKMKTERMQRAATKMIPTYKDFS